MIELQPDATLNALVRCRQVVMTRANDILTGTLSQVSRQESEATHTLTALLMGMESVRTSSSTAVGGSSSRRGTYTVISAASSRWG